MKKIAVLFVIMLFSIGVVLGQEQTQTQNQKKVQTQSQAQTGEQSGDPIMAQERIRTNEGEGTMKRVENREMKKQKHGSVDNGTTKQNRSGVQQHDRDRTNVHARPQTNRPSGFGVPQGVRSGGGSGSMHRGGKR